MSNTRLSILQVMTKWFSFLMGVYLLQVNRIIHAFRETPRHFEQTTLIHQIMTKSTEKYLKSTNKFFNNKQKIILGWWGGGGKLCFHVSFSYGTLFVIILVKLHTTKSYYHHYFQQIYQKIGLSSLFSLLIKVLPKYRKSKTTGLILYKFARYINVRVH